LDKRRYTRTSVYNVTADVSDGKGFFYGEITNISETGLLLKGVSKKINHHAKNMSLIVTEGDKNYKVLAQPMWAKQKISTKVLGFKVLENNLDWIKFNNRIRPKTVDVWAASSLRA
jgi:hypothetical protein